DADRDRRVEPRLDAAEGLEHSAFRTGREAEEPPDRVVAAIEQRARSERRERALELVGRRGRRDHEVARVEVAPEPRRPLLEAAQHLAAGELLEEVLDQVLLGQALDQLDLLDRDGGLVRHRPGEVDRGSPVRLEQPEELAAGDEWHRDTGRAAAAAEL